MAVDFAGTLKRPHLQQSLFLVGSAILLIGLLIYCYWFGISEMLHQWRHDEDMGHGFIVPILAAWIAWSGRSRWMKQGVQPSWWGFVPLVFSALLLYVAIAGAGKFVACVALLLAICGVVLILGGPNVLRGLAFPLLLLLFMLPKLAIVYNQITLPMQLLATRLAGFALSAGGVHVVRSGNILYLNTFSVSVVEACSGIRYLLSLSFMALVYGYFAGAGAWMRLVLMLAMAPAAILANALRVAAVALLGSVNPRLAEGFMHTASGWVIFVATLVAGVGLYHCLIRGWNRLHA
jgi:exosortase